MTIADQLLSISNTKAAIKTAIEAKGVTVGSVAFDQYPSKIASITGGGGEVIPDWVRPADWLAMPSFAAGEQKIAGLFPVFDTDSNVVAFNISGAYTVDWGDGVTENFAANTIASHNYSYASISDTTLSSRGYKQVIITITPQAGQNLTIITMNSVATGNQAAGIYVLINWLDLIISAPNLATTANLTLSQGSTNTWPLCERVWIKEYNAAGVRLGSSTFYNFSALQNLPAFSIYSTTVNLTSTFQSCQALEKLEGFTFPVATMDSMFSGCTNLKSINCTFAGSSITGSKMASMFNNCYKLKEIPSSLAGAAPTLLNSTFANCWQIKSIPALNYTNVTNMSNTFEKCYSLESFPTTTFPSATICSFMMSNCKNLVSLNLTFSAATTLANAFDSCDKLEEVNLTTPNTLTNTSNMFSGCSKLTKVNAFNTSFVTTAIGMYSGGRCLQVIPAHNLNRATSLTTLCSSAFNVSRILATGVKVTTSIASLKLSGTALNEFYTNLATVTGQTLTVSGNYGIAGDDPTIATAKGWTVSGS